MTLLGRWAAEAEECGFESVGVIDRLIYDNLDPLTALAAAAACTSHVELLSTVVNVCWRNNPALLAKQLSSVARLSGGRLTAGLGMGGWPADYDASGVPLAGRGVRFDAALAQLGQAARIMVGGTVPASFRRAASEPSNGWVAPLFGLDLLRDGARATQDAWKATGREDEPRILTGRYVSLGPGAERNADTYIHHYYGADFFAAARADTLISADQIHSELERLWDAGCTDVLLFPCSGDLAQVATLAGVLEGALA